jgi:hypothetical protein
MRRAVYCDGRAEYRARRAVTCASVATLIGSGGNVIWTFERAEEVLRVETRIDNATGEYLIVTTWAERPPEVERFRDHGVFQLRVRALEAQLLADKWSQVGNPSILSDGWRGPIPH